MKRRHTFLYSSYALLCVLPAKKSVSLLLFDSACFTGEIFLVWEEMCHSFSFSDLVLFWKFEGGIWVTGFEVIYRAPYTIWAEKLLSIFPYQANINYGVANQYFSLHWSLLRSDNGLNTYFGSSFCSFNFLGFCLFLCCRLDNNFLIFCTHFDGFSVLWYELELSSYNKLCLTCFMF